MEINFISSSKQPVNKVQITSMVLHHTSPLANSSLTICVVLGLVEFILLYYTKMCYLEHLDIPKKICTVDSTLGTTLDTTLL